MLSIDPVPINFRTFSTVIRIFRCVGAVYRSNVLDESTKTRLRMSGLFFWLGPTVVGLWMCAPSPRPLEDLPGVSVNLNTIRKHSSSTVAVEGAWSQLINNLRRCYYHYVATIIIGDGRRSLARVTATGQKLDLASGIETPSTESDVRRYGFTASVTSAAPGVK